jgi:hypothetical protein
MNFWTKNYCLISASIGIRHPLSRMRKGAEGCTMATLLADRPSFPEIEPKRP